MSDLHYTLIISLWYLMPVYMYSASLITYKYYIIVTLCILVCC